MPNLSQLIAGAFLLGLCGQVALGAASITEPETLVYRGEITFEDNATAFELYRRSVIKPTRIEITSLGGGINAGLQLGEWIVANQLAVRVPRYCVSACANYIFVAGKTKYLGATAYLVWHGGAYQPGLADILKANANREIVRRLSVTDQATARAQKYQEIDGYMEFIQHRETAYFDALNIDPRITTLGQIEPYVSRFPQGIAFSGWDYSIEDMAKMGVLNVFIEGEQWVPSAASRGVRIHRLTLE